MKKILLFTTLLFVGNSFTSFSQEVSTKKITKRVKGLKNTIQEYSVIKSGKNVKHGAYKEFYKKELVVDGSYKNGKKDGFWTYRSPDDSYVQKGVFKEGERVGKWEGVLKGKEVYSSFYAEDSKLDTLKQFNFKGELVASFIYNKDEDKGEGFVKYNTEFMLKYTTYSHTQDYHGVVKILYPNGSTFQEKKYDKGKLVWASDIYKDNGEVQRKVNFKNGNGSIVKYFPEELTKGLFVAESKTKYKDSVPNGIKSVLDKDGKIIASGIQYKNTRVGTWKIWSLKNKNFIDKEYQKLSEIDLLRDENETITSNQNNFNSNAVDGSLFSCVLMQNVGKKNNCKHKQDFSTTINKYFTNGIDFDVLKKHIGTIPKGYIYKDYITFKINAFGEVSDVEVEYDNKKTRDYFTEFIKEFPVVIPASSDGRFVNLLFSLPIVFKVR